MRKSLYDYCIEYKRMELLEQWDDTANLPLTPQTVSYGSSYKAHWCCSKGHKWQVQVWSRTGHIRDCPVCAGRSVISGENDLQTLYPEIAAQWHPKKNIDITPRRVSAYTNRKAWWLCPKCGHEWNAGIKSRTYGSGCPVCTGRTVVSGINDLATRYPDLAAEWLKTKNGVFNAEDVSPRSRRKVWWQCNACGYEYQASIASRTNGTGCPVCAGKAVVPGINDFASRFPELAKEWHPTKNGSLMPNAVTAYSNRNVLWVCSQGHEFKSDISARAVRHSQCPYCSNTKVLPGFNDLASRLPSVAKEWHPTFNGSLTPEQVTCGSAKRVWWKCSDCGNEWKAYVFSRAGAQRCGCPMCASKIKLRASI